MPVWLSGNSRPALLDQLAGVDRNRQPYIEELRRIWVGARWHGKHIYDLAEIFGMLLGGFELLPPAICPEAILGVR
jgi:hypothetical protein